MIKSSEDYLNFIRRNSSFTWENNSGLENENIKKDYLVASTKFSDNLGDWAEFGVQKGNTARVLLDCLPTDKNIYLFDSFEGLPEDWIIENPEEANDGIREVCLAGSFFTDIIPVFNDNRAIVIKGLYNDTLPIFVRDYNTPFSIIHMDSDLYSSAKSIYKNAGHLIRKGTVLIFDDFFRDHDKKAFLEFIESTNFDFEYLMAIRGSFKVTLKII
jgi:hypothetical protein